MAKKKDPLNRPAHPHEFQLMGTKTVKLSQIVFDGSLYPRVELSQYNIASLVEKMRAGTVLDPICVEEGTLRIVDGAHRWKAYQQFSDSDLEVRVAIYRYNSELNLFRHAIKLNLQHGIRLSRQDQTLVAWKLMERGLADDEIGTALGLTDKSVQDLKSRWAWGGELSKKDQDIRKVDGGGMLRDPSGRAVGPKGELVPLKGSTRHLGGATLNPAQVEANDKILGVPQLRIINDVIRMIEGGILDSANPRVIERLKKLGGLIEGLFSATSATS